MVAPKQECRGLNFMTVCVKVVPALFSAVARHPFFKVSINDDDLILENLRLEK